MFYTPGWGAVLTLTGTLGGVLTTQIVNSAISRGTRRRERNASITKAVGELIGSGNAWVYVASTQEQDLFRAIATRVPEEQLNGYDRVSESRGLLGPTCVRKRYRGDQAGVPAGGRQRSGGPPPSRPRF